MLYPLVLVLHVFVCFILIGVILLQAGRGGGLTEAFSGAAQSMFGTRGAVYLTRATTACAVIFMLTSLSLAYMSAQRGRSLMEGTRVAAPVEPAAQQETEAAQPAPAAAATAPVAEPAPAAETVPAEATAPQAEQKSE